MFLFQTKAAAAATDAGVVLALSTTTTTATTGVPSIYLQQTNQPIDISTEVFGLRVAHIRGHPHPIP